MTSVAECLTNRQERVDVASATQFCQQDIETDEPHDFLEISLSLNQLSTDRVTGFVNASARSPPM